MKPVVVFGAGKIAEVVSYLMREEAARDVVAFTVDRAFVPGAEKDGLPVVPFDEVEHRFPPADFDMFVALGYHDLNALRQRKVAEAKAKGYALPAFVHPRSGLPANTVVGDNCFVMNDVLVHPYVSLGDNVFVWSGAVIGHHTAIGPHCWITSGANIAGVVSVGSNCFFAINATIAHGVTIGNECFLGANTLVTKSADSGQTFVAESTKPFRLTSRQFLRMSSFSNL